MTTRFSSMAGPSAIAMAEHVAGHSAMTMTMGVGDSPFTVGPSAVDVDDLLDLVLRSDGVPPGLTPGSPQTGDAAVFSPTFWACFQDPELLPSPEDWLLPPPAASSTTETRSAPVSTVYSSSTAGGNSLGGGRRGSTLKRSFSDAEAVMARSAYTSSFFTEVVEEPEPEAELISEKEQQLKSFAPPPPRPHTTNTCFAFMIPSIDPVLVEGDDGSSSAAHISVAARTALPAPKRVKVRTASLPEMKFTIAPKAGPSDKRAKVQRYLEKRQRRLERGSRPAVYVRRTELANLRPRVHGRFISQPSEFVPVTEL
jgi:hypothetical protein